MEACVMPMRDRILSDKVKLGASTPSTDQARAQRASYVEDRAADPRGRSRSLPVPASDEDRNGHQPYGGDLGYLLLQINVICVLLFLIATTAIMEYSDWFGGMPVTTQ